MSYTVKREATILGGLPIIVEVSFGYDSFSLEHWAEVQHIYWCGRKGSCGKEISNKVRDRAEKYDPYFSNLIENISEQLAYEGFDGVKKILEEEYASSYKEYFL